MRIAALVYLAPRKLGSLEQWVVEFLSQCTGRGHSVHLFCQTPMHPAVAAELARLGVPWTPFDRLEAQPARWSQILRGSFDVIYMNLVVPRSPGAYAAYLAWPLPIYFFDGISGAIPGYRRRSWIGRILDPIAFTRVKALAGCSRYVVERDQRRFHLRPTSCTVVYNGIDTERFRPPTEPYPEVPVITSTAYLIPEKGLDILIDACTRLRDLPWRLVITGDGPDETRLQAYVRRVGLADRTSFLGLQDRVESVLRGAEIYVHPCLWEEAFGLTIVEGMASGCATVASRVGGIPEIIEDGKSGVLVERGDARGLAQVLRALLMDPARRRALGAAARSRVVERFSLAPAVAGQVDWLEHQWSRRRGRTPRSGN